MARTKRVSKARKGRRVQSKRVGKKRTKRSSKSSSRSNKRMRRSFIKKSRGRSRRSLRRMRGGSAKYAPNYQYWKERDPEKRDYHRQLALKADSTSGFGDITQWEKSLAKLEDNYVRTLHGSFKNRHLAPAVEAQYSNLMRHYNGWPLGPRGLSGKEEWIDPKDVYNSSE